MRFVSIKLIMQKYHEEVAFQLFLIFHKLNMNINLCWRAAQLNLLKNVPNWK